ncbi:hypothetical protein SDC9_178722 [bioreactor metagenome]|uniref:Uncharacterized protein n=1 Tax=bioreactor metagenome TaxID=1076179 RepID=A0A645GWZ4_9ZZZZ
MGRQLCIFAVAVDGDHSLIGRIRAAEHLHQRGFTRPVFAQQYMHFAGLHIKLDVVERNGPGEVFGDVSHLNDGFQIDTLLS